MSDQSNPHIRDDYSPLETLALQALRRHGEFAPETLGGEVMLMMIELANEVVEEVRRHPYWKRNPDHDTIQLTYYKSQTEAQPIPDPLMIAGLLFKYALQQGSAKAAAYQATYHTMMSTLLWNRLGYARPTMTVMDGGSNKNYDR